jgi:RNA polymerase sigma factor (sigma-70 family)
MMQLVKARSQDTSSFMEELYQRHRLTIFTYILRHISSKEDAEDILLEVFIAAIESPIFMTLNEHQQFAWLRRVAQHKSIDYLRRSKYQIAIPIEQTIETLYEDEQYSPEQVTLHREEVTRLQAHISTLSELQQEVIKLRFTQNLRCTEIATRLNKSEGAIRTLLSRTLNLLHNTYTNGRKEAQHD